MKLAVTAITLAFFLTAQTEPSAGTIYQWTDQDGVVHLTNVPPPAGVDEQKVSKYKTREPVKDAEKPVVEEAEESVPITPQPEIVERKPSIYDRVADRALSDAEEAKKKATEAMDRVNAHNAKKKPRKRKQLIEHKRVGRRLVEEANMAVARANQAIARANQAAKRANEAAGEPGL